MYHCLALGELAFGGGAHVRLALTAAELFSHRCLQMAMGFDFS